LVPEPPPYLNLHNLRVRLEYAPKGHLVRFYGKRLGQREAAQQLVSGVPVGNIRRLKVVLAMVDHVLRTYPDNRQLPREWNYFPSNKHKQLFVAEWWKINTPVRKWILSGKKINK
jgi:hypothetical protein